MRTSSGGSMLTPDVMSAALGRVAAGAMGHGDVLSARSYEYEQVAVELRKLRIVVESAISADEADAAAYWKNLPHARTQGLVLIAGMHGVSRDVSGLGSRVLRRLAKVEKICSRRLEVHADVPRRLEADSDTWSRNKAEVDDKILRCQRLGGMTGWAGEARANYDAAVDVQRAALRELSGIMRSTSLGCLNGAALNRAVFFAVGKAVGRSRRLIRTERGMNAEYRRCVTAFDVLGDLRARIHDAIRGGVIAGSEEELSIEMERTVSMPNLLRPGFWPTGTSAVGTEPAPTDQGVTDNHRPAVPRVIRGPRNSLPNIIL